MRNAQVREALATFDELTQAREARSPAAELLKAATAYSDAAMLAARGEADPPIEDGNDLVEAAEAAARMQLLDWPTAEAQARARFWHGYLMMGDQPDAAYDRLGGLVRWSKLLLATLPFDADEDFAAATNTVFVSSIAYLLAYRYIKPEDRHRADKGIAQDIERTFRRVFPDQVLGDRFVAAVGEMEARA